VGMRDRRKIWQLSLRDEDELGEDIHVIARPHLARPSCSKSYACLTGGNLVCGMLPRWQLSLRDEDELGEDIHVIARPHLARPSCSKSYACLFSSPQTPQTHHTPGDIKDPNRHQAVVNAHFHLLTEVAVVGTPSIPPLFPTPEAVKEVGSS